MLTSAVPAAAASLGTWTWRMTGLRKILVGAISRENVVEVRIPGRIFLLVKAAKNCALNLNVMHDSAISLYLSQSH